jgi:S-adenosylmethionine:tRNA ribosyltransferase-isomerase
MKTSDFSFNLPERLIAQYPPAERGKSRLMVLDRQSGCRSHSTVEQLPELLCDLQGPSGEKPLLVFNDSKVRKARLKGCDERGSETEFLLLEKIENDELGPGNIWKVLTKRSGRKKPGARYVFRDSSGSVISGAVLLEGEGEYRFLEFDRPFGEEWLELYGAVPLPPYIKREANFSDGDRYQTVYARITGSAAAPTAGLHFTRDLLDRIESLGIGIAFVTLHVGLGTFLPVRSEAVEDHRMHEERFFISEENAAKIEDAKAKGRKIVAVGTTSVRTLESAWTGGGLVRGAQSTSIFIYPPYEFRIVDSLFTNFHTPLSSLLMLVSAFAGRELILESYNEAIELGYRFFSYGDAMLIK